MTPPRWRALAECFELGTVLSDPVHVTRGAMGEIWRLETTAGRWAVKWQFPWVPTDARPADLAVQAGAASAGIPLPRPVTTPAGDAVVLVDGAYARVYEWVDLGPAVQPEALGARAGEVGRLLGTLHGLAISSDEPVDPWYTSAPRPQEWDELIDRARSSGAGWAARIAAARPLIDELTQQVGPASERQPVVCHRDFNPDNLLPRARGGQLVVLDWENSGPLDPSRELGYALFCWAPPGEVFDGAAADALLAAYATASGAAPAMEAGLFATALATHLNVLHVMAQRAISDPAHRDYAEQQVSGLLDRDLPDLSRFTERASAALRLF